MCRLFALHGNHPTSAAMALIYSEHSLVRQSCRDASGEQHGNGWGIGYYDARGVHRIRAVAPADADPNFRTLAESVVAPMIVAHVRQASMGAVAERNSHPFVHGRWLFAHNGTLIGFDRVRERVRQSIPALLRARIEGETDSEHAFFLLLARLEKDAGSLDEALPAATVGRALAATIEALATLCPDAGAERSAFNFIVTDGRILVASRWGRSLFWLERRGIPTDGLDRPAERTPDYHAIAVASEPTSPADWRALPERTMLLVDADLAHAIVPA